MNRLACTHEIGRAEVWDAEPLPATRRVSGRSAAGDRWGNWSTCTEG